MMELFTKQRAPIMRELVIAAVLFTSALDGRIDKRIAAKAGAQPRRSVEKAKLRVKIEQDQPRQRQVTKRNDPLL
jgi:hypothetical protein